MLAFWIIYGVVFIAFQVVYWSIAFDDCGTPVSEFKDWKRKSQERERVRAQGNKDSYKEACAREQEAARGFFGSIVALLAVFVWPVLIVFAFFWLIGFLIYMFWILVKNLGGLFTAAFGKFKD